jgi:hypothetical protein
LQTARQRLRSRLDHGFRRPDRLAGRGIASHPPCDVVSLLIIPQHELPDRFNSSAKRTQPKNLARVRFINRRRSGEEFRLLILRARSAIGAPRLERAAASAARSTGDYEVKKTPYPARSMVSNREGWKRCLGHKARIF